MESGFQQRLEAIRQRIADACARAARNPASVHVLPVSKNFGPEAVREAADAGLTVFGENRVQEARNKIPLCPARLNWHLIGHLQSNKVRHAVRLFTTIHSADSVSLLEKLDAACAEEGRRLDVFLEINLAGEAAKFGMKPEDAQGAVERANSLTHLDVTGLMAVPPSDPDPERVRPYFRQLRELRERLRDRTGTRLPELSMGMSHDFEVAIEEGATWIRVGTALFGSRPKGEAA